MDKWALIDLLCKNFHTFTGDYIPSSFKGYMLVYVSYRKQYWIWKTKNNKKDSLLKNNEKTYTDDICIPLAPYSNSEIFTIQLNLVDNIHDSVFKNCKASLVHLHYIKINSHGLINLFIKDAYIMYTIKLNEICLGTSREIPRSIHLRTATRWQVKSIQYNLDFTV